MTDVFIVIALSITLGSIYSLFDARFEWARINKKLYAEHRNLNLLLNILLAAAAIILGFYIL